MLFKLKRTYNLKPSDKPPDNLSKDQESPLRARKKIKKIFLCLRVFCQYLCVEYGATSSFIKNLIVLHCTQPWSWWVFCCWPKYLSFLSESRSTPPTNNSKSQLLIFWGISPHHWWHYLFWCLFKIMQTFNLHCSSATPMVLSDSINIWSFMLEIVFMCVCVSISARKIPELTFTVHLMPPMWKGFTVSLPSCITSWKVN